MKRLDVYIVAYRHKSDSVFIGKRGPLDVRRVAALLRVYIFNKSVGHVRRIYAYRFAGFSVGVAIVLTVYASSAVPGHILKFARYGHLHPYLGHEIRIRSRRSYRLNNSDITVRHDPVSYLAGRLAFQIGRNAYVNISRRGIYRYVYVRRIQIGVLERAGRVLYRVCV